MLNIAIEVKENKIWWLGISDLWMKWYNKPENLLRSDEAKTHSKDGKEGLSYLEISIHPLS